MKVLFVPNAEESIKTTTKKWGSSNYCNVRLENPINRKRAATGVQIFILQRTLSGWAIAFVRPVGAIPRSVAPPSFGQASVLVLAAEFLFTAPGAGEFVVSQAAILSAVTDPTFGNARVVAVATVLVGQAFTFGSCTHPIHGRFPFVWRFLTESWEFFRGKPVEKEIEDGKQKSRNIE